jgi:hypothetical protein
MIAQVHTGKGTPGAVPSDEQRKFVEDALAQGRAQDGCEATISLADPKTGEALVINLFRDEAALEAFQAYSKQKIAEAEEMGGGEVSPGRVYPDVIALL